MSDVQNNRGKGQQIWKIQRMKTSPALPLSLLQVQWKNIIFFRWRPILRKIREKRNNNSKQFKKKHKNKNKQTRKNRSNNAKKTCKISRHDSMPESTILQSWAPFWALNIILQAKLLDWLVLSKWKSDFPAQSRHLAGGVGWVLALPDPANFPSRMTTFGPQPFSSHARGGVK